MPVESVVYLLEPDTAQRQCFECVTLSVGSCVHAVGEVAGAFDTLCRVCPDVLVVGASLSVTEIIPLCRQVRAHPYLPACHILMLSNDALPDEIAMLVDDVLRRDAPDHEILARLQSGIRQAQYRRRMEAMRQELEHLRGEQERTDGYMTETTTQLVEIAAQLQSEVVHSVEREEESVRSAQADTIAQAAAGLRHEINNPLFAIVGSAESALKRLNAGQAASEADLTPIVTSLERILRGADRIQHVVQTISEMLSPVTTDYVPGVSMLRLSKEIES